MRARKTKQPHLVGKDDRFDNSKFFIESGIDLEKRTISIYDEIDSQSAKTIVRGLKKMIEINSDANDPNSLINVEIGSYGGDTYYMMAIYDALTQSPVQIHTHAQGPVMSAGLVIYLAGDARFADSNVTFMAHTASDEHSGKEFEQRISMSELKRINKLMIDILAVHSNQNVKWWTKKLQHEDFYFDYNIALQLGIITHEYKELDLSVK